MSEKLNESKDYYVVDSMPLEVCKIARANRCKICCDVDYAQPNFGYCAWQKTRFFGYKLHAICSVEGVFTSFDLTPASVHDIPYLKDIKQQMSDSVILGGFVQSSEYTIRNTKKSKPKRLSATILSIQKV